MRPSLLITRPLPAPIVNAARDICVVTLRDSNLAMSEAEASESLLAYDAILPTLGDGFSQAAFQAAGGGKCRLLANFGVGYNHIDVAAAKASDTAVSNTPGAVTDATADIAMTLMLMTARLAGEGERLVRSGAWPGWHPTQLLGMHVTGKVLGIIGMGRIGKAVARRAHFGFDMDVVFFNRSPVVDPGIPGARQLPDIASVMASADIISISVPGGLANRHLIDAKALAAAKPGAILVNTARGDVIDENALITALQTGKLAGAGLDVYEHEPKVPGALRSLESVVLLPHLGTAALEVRTAMGLMAVDNIRAFFAGNPLPNPV